MLSMTSLFLPPTTAAAVILIMTTAAAAAATLPNFTAVIVFGDSTMDTGNNKYLTEPFFKADHLPYGKQFPTGKPTGRFSNGKLIPDFVADLLAVKKTMPPYMDPNLSDDEIKTGVVFASSGTGFDELTALTVGAVPMGKQVEMFREYIGRLREVFGEEVADRTVGEALVLVSCGSNDMIISYYDLRIRWPEYDVDGYQNYLLGKVETFVKEIYSQGGRTIAVYGLPPIGCIPLQMTASLELDPRNRQCIGSQNSDSQTYNSKLETLLTRLQASLPGSKILYANFYDPLLDIITNPKNYGFEETGKGCCGSGLVEMEKLCLPLTPTCGDKTSKYVFFDSIHPTEATNYVLAQSFARQLMISVTQL